MCGIYGIVDLQGAMAVECAERRRDAMSHRGPDDAGIWLAQDGRVALGHRRLSIIDLSPAGHQPMGSPCGRYVITFNGEIYNYLELKVELEKIGCHFRSNSDTEVVLAAYAAWGADCLARFNGMFAFAIYEKGSESKAAQLFVARDRVGKKPFYYRHDAANFEFASELKSVQAGAQWDLRALNFYLALGYVPDDLCLAEGVCKLPAAHAGLLDLASGAFKVWRYWSLPANVADPASDCADLAQRAEALLMDAVHVRLRSDVPVGVLLSGGLDSSLVAAAAARQSASRVQTFTIALPGSSYDESGYARQVADHLGTEHHVLPIPKPSLSVLEELSSFIDEPIADSSLIPAYLVSRLTVGQVKVALGGDGGDELFGGYSDYSTALVDQKKIGWVPHGLLGWVGRMAGRLPAGVRGRNRLFALQGGAYQSLIWGSPYFDLALRRRIFDPAALEKLGAQLAEPEHWLLEKFGQGRDPVDRMTRTHFQSILPDDFLVKVDRASMAVSLEVRCPLLDYRLVEFAFSEIPSSCKVTGGDSRIIQKIMAKHLLPKNLNVNRKQGFSIPLDDWLRASGCVEVHEWAVSLPAAISRREVDRLITGHMRGRANGARLYALLMLGIAEQGWERRA
ncbi:MAG: asparagine synthase (glutamine-hydrolyzing) [Pseudomonadota bacterium]